MKASLLLLICFTSVVSAQQTGKSLVADLLPRGNYPVGFRATVVDDPTRTFSPKSGVAVPRPVRTFVWYPARRTGQHQSITVRDYVVAEGKGIEDAPTRLSEMAGVALSGDQVSTILDARLSVFDNANPASGRFPVVILGGGLNGTAYLQTLLAEYLASHGYVVVALSSLSAREGEKLSFDKAGLGLLVGDLQFAIQNLKRNQQVNATRLALVGWSVGGVALAALQEAELDAFVSLDSGLSYNYGPPLLDEYSPGRQSQGAPILDLQCLAPGRFVVPRDNQYFESAKGKVVQVRISSLNHAQCTSLPLLVSAVTGIGDSEQLRNGYRTLAAHSKAFLDLHVRH